MYKKKQKRLPEIPVEYSTLSWIAFSFLLILVFFASSFKVMGDDDFFWHLATGRYIAENQIVPDKDVFGFVTAGTDWIPFEWGWDVISYSVYSLGGYNAILILRSAIFILFFLLYFLLLKKFDVHPLLSILLLFILLAGMIDRLSPRPHMFTYLFFILLLNLLLYYRYISRENYLRKLYFIPLIFLVWCNLHMGVLAGGLILLLFAVSEIISYKFPPKSLKTGILKPSKIQINTILIISFISLLVLLINPHGINTYIYAYNHTKLKMLESIGEWQNPFTGRIDMNFIITIYKVLLFSSIIIFIYAIKKKDLFFALIAVVFIIYSVRAARFTVDYDIIILFFIAVSIKYFLRNISFNKIPSNKIILNTLYLILIIFFGYTSYLTYTDKIYSIIDYYRRSGWGIDENYMPAQLFLFMKENNITGNPFNHFETGGYLIWSFPGQKNFIDSRNLSDHIFQEYNNILYRKTGFEGKFESYNFDFVIYFNPEMPKRINDMNNHITGYLSRNNIWKLVYWDDKSMLFLKDIPKYSEVIEKYSYMALNPVLAYFYRGEFEERIKSDPEATSKEIERKTKTEPNGAIFKAIYPIALNYLSNR